MLGDFIDRLGRTAHGAFTTSAACMPGDEHEPANITPLALRTSRAANGVSRRHGEVARACGSRSGATRPESDVPIGHVTNGVHVVDLDGGADAGLARPASRSRLA